MVSCSAMDEEPYMDEPYIYGNMLFDYETMTFNTTYESDILYDTGNAKEDFIILHQNFNQEVLSDESIVIYHDLFDKLISLSDTTHEPIGRLFDYSSTQIKTALEDHLIDVNLNDIVTFNEIKQLLSSYKEQSSRPSIRKPDYLSFILDKNLTTEDLEDLGFLQEAYLELYANKGYINIKEMSFEDLVSAFESIGKTYSEDQTTSLGLAYDMLTLVFNRNTEV
jgi:hypothetical protein